VPRLSSNASEFAQFVRDLVTKITRLFPVLTIASIAMATPTVTILSPKASSDSGSPVFYEAYATSATCASGISAMRIYTASGVSAYSVNGAHIETFIPLSAGSYSTIVQAWDNCGGVAKATVDVTVNSDAGVSVFLPSSKSADIPVHIAASAQNPDCLAGINAIRIYTGNAIAPYTVDSNQVNTFVNLLPGSYDLTVQAWDNCGHVYKAPLTEAAVGAADGYLYATTANTAHTNTSTGIAEFTITDGALTNPNGSGNPPTFTAASGVNSIAVDPGGWFVYAPTPTGIYAYQIDQSNGNLWPVPGSPFPLNGITPSSIAVDPNGNFVFVGYNTSNVVAAYRINRSSGALTETATVTGSGGINAVTADFTGQYLYADNNNNEEVTVWGWAVNPNNGTLTAVPGSPNNVPAGNFGGLAMSSTMLPADSPAQPLLYVLIGGPSNPQMGYAANFGSGALTDTPGYDPSYCDECGTIVADNQGKWIWGFSTAPTNPAQNWFEILTIGTNGTITGTEIAPLTDALYIYALAEDGSGQYLYASGMNCPTEACVGTVTSWKLDDGVPTALTGPLNTGSNAVAYGMGVALKHGG
jgi:hypothetical protein